MDVSVLLEPELRFEELARVLDELGFEGRLHAVREWGKATQAKLFEAAKGKHPLDVSHFVPSGTDTKQPVRHYGKNTLPFFNHFEKRFCKLEAAEGSDGTIVGYNHQDMGVLTGPGYFTVRNGDEAGEIAIDYTVLPTQRADGWPEIIPNDARLGGKVVYAGMVDHMRGISSTVSIGRAAKAGKMMDAWFVLVREDAPS